MPELKLEIDKHGTAAAPFCDPGDCDDYDFRFMGPDEADLSAGGDSALMPLPGRIDVLGIAPGMLVCIEGSTEHGPERLQWITDKSYWAVVACSRSELVLYSSTPNSARGTRKWLKSIGGRRAVANGRTKATVKA